jgi:Flp pilus assembly pilin Flp
LVLLLAPIKAVAGLIEYALILTLVAILVVVALQLPPGATTVTRQLQSTVLTAQAANNGGNKSQELSNLSKAIGLEEALRGMIATCDSSACSAAAADLQELVGLTAKLRARLLTTPGCKPDGIVESNEICDPLATPTGCPTVPVPTFCTDTCDCAELPTTTTSTTTSTVACPAGDTDCSGVCVDLTSDPDNCGGCGILCPAVTPACIASTCQIP